MGDANETTTTSKSGRTRVVATRSSGRLKAAKLADDVTLALKERILGALWLMTRGAWTSATLASVRAHLEDVSAADLERAICALVLDGRVELRETSEGTLLRMRAVPGRSPVAIANAFYGEVRARVKKLAANLPRPKLAERFLARKTVKGTNGNGA